MSVCCEMLDKLLSVCWEMTDKLLSVCCEISDKLLCPFVVKCQANCGVCVHIYIYIYVYICVYILYIYIYNMYYLCKMNTDMTTKFIDQRSWQFSKTIHRRHQS